MKVELEGREPWILLVLTMVVLPVAAVLTTLAISGSTSVTIKGDSEVNLKVKLEGGDLELPLKVISPDEVEITAVVKAIGPTEPVVVGLQVAQPDPVLLGIEVEARQLPPAKGVAVPVKPEVKSLVKKKPLKK